MCGIIAVSYFWNAPAQRGIILYDSPCEGSFVTVRAYPILCVYTLYVWALRKDEKTLPCEVVVYYYDCMCAIRVTPLDDDELVRNQILSQKSRSIISIPPTVDNHYRSYCLIVGVSAYPTSGVCRDHCMTLGGHGDPPRDYTFSWAWYDWCAAYLIDTPCHPRIVILWKRVTYSGYTLDRKWWGSQINGCIDTMFVPPEY